MSFTDYTVVVGDNPEDLQTKVAEKIGDGYQPFGAPIMQWGSFSLVQVVVKGSENGGGGEGSASVDTLEGATETGKALMKAASPAAVRTAIDAGTSNLEIGKTATTAMAGNTVIPSIPTSLPPTDGSVTNLKVAADAAIELAKLGNVTAYAAGGITGGTLQATFNALADRVKALETK